MIIFGAVTYTTIFDFSIFAVATTFFFIWHSFHPHCSAIAFATPGYVFERYVDRSDVLHFERKRESCFICPFFCHIRVNIRRIDRNDICRV